MGMAFQCPNVLPAMAAGGHGIQSAFDSFTGCAAAQLAIAFSKRCARSSACLGACIAHQLALGWETQASTGCAVCITCPLHCVQARRRHASCSGLHLAMSAAAALPAACSFCCMAVKLSSEVIRWFVRHISLSYSVSPLLALSWVIPQTESTPGWGLLQQRGGT